MKKRSKRNSEKKEILQQISLLNKKLESMSQREGKIEKAEKRIEKEEKKIEKEEVQVEHVLFKIGNVMFKRKHLLGFIRGIAGSFLGVSLGKALLNQEALANQLSWWNILGITLFILFISGLLIYKNEKEYVKTKGYGIIAQRLVFLYVLSLLVELMSLWLFNALPAEFGTLVKVLIIGSYAAMAGAVSFTVI